GPAGADGSHGRRARRARNVPFADRARGALAAEGGAEALVRGAESCLDPLEQALRLVGAQNALLGEPLGEELSHARVAGDLLRHQRLCISGLVLLVVAMPAVADQV